VSDHPVFDEEIALRRFQVALKRADWRMFEQALERLGEEIAAHAPFSRHQAWQDFARSANERPDLPDFLKERLRQALGSLLAVETRVVPQPAGASANAGSGVAIVVGWQSGLADPAVRQAFANWLSDPMGPHGPPAARRLLLQWLDDGLSLAAIAHRANLSLAAVGAGLGLEDPPWVDTFYAGLARALDTLAAPPLTRLGDALAGAVPACVIVAEPGTIWERHYAATELDFGVGRDGPHSIELIKLGGSLDLFACARCHHAVRCPTSGVRSLSVACPACGEPALPLVLPLDRPAFAPPGGRVAWERAAERLREAGTWVLIDPPAPAGDTLTRWLTGILTPGKRLLVVAGGRSGDGLEAWQAFLAPFGPRAMVTSQGPADEVLGFLLQGGVPELEPAVSADVSFAPKKKTRR
jgi:hypothetical protein